MSVYYKWFDTVVFYGSNTPWSIINYYYWHDINYALLTMWYWFCWLLKTVRWRIVIDFDIIWSLVAKCLICNNTTSSYFSIEMVFFLKIDCFFVVELFVTLIFLILPTYRFSYQYLKGCFNFWCFLKSYLICPTCINGYSRVPLLSLMDMKRALGVLNWYL